MRSCLSVALLFSTPAYSVALPGIRDHWSGPYNLRPNPLYPYVRSPVARSQGNISTYDSHFWKDPDVSPSRTRRSTKNLKFRAGSLQPRQDASTTAEQYLDTRPTPDPTGVPSVRTTVFIASEKDFALLLPKDPGGMFELCADYQALAAINAFFIRARIRRRDGRSDILYPWEFWRSLRKQDARRAHHCRIYRACGGRFVDPGTSRMFLAG